MSTSIVFLGKPDLAHLISDGTALTLATGGTADAGNGILVDHIRLVNTTGGAIDVTVDIYDIAETTAYLLLDSHTLAAQSTESTPADVSSSVYKITEWNFVPSGHLLRVTAAAGVHCFAATVSGLGVP